MAKRFDVGTRVRIVMPENRDFNMELGTILELSSTLSDSRYKVMIDKYKDYYYIKPEHVRPVKPKCMFDG